MKSRSYNEYTIRRAEPNDVAGFVKLHDIAFERWGSEARKQFHWKYTDNPYVDELPVLVAERDGEIVGARGYFALEMVIGGERVLGLQSGDLMVHPEHRRKGLFRQMNEFGLEMYDDDSVIFFSVPGDVPRKGYLKTGWKEVSNPLYIRVIDEIYPEIDSVKKLAFRAGRTAYDAVLKVSDQIVGGESDYEIIEYDSDPSGLLESLYHRHVPNEIHSRRSAEFYSWRLAEPIQEYSIYSTRKDGNDVAAIVTSKRNSSMIVRDILPFDAPNGAVLQLLRHALEEADGCRFLQSWCPATLDQSVLLKAGMLPGNLIPGNGVTQNPVVRETNKSWNESLEDITDPLNWNLHMIELDY